MRTSERWRNVHVYNQKDWWEHPVHLLPWNSLWKLEFSVFLSTEHSQGLKYTTYFINSLVKLPSIGWFQQEDGPFHCALVMVVMPSLAHTLADALLMASDSSRRLALIRCRSCGGTAARIAKSPTGSLQPKSQVKCKCETFSCIFTKLLVGSAIK